MVALDLSLAVTLTVRFEYRSRQDSVSQLHVGCIAKCDNILAGNDRYIQERL
jgi:hypothetical protein